MADELPRKTRYRGDRRTAKLTLRRAAIGKQRYFGPRNAAIGLEQRRHLTTEANWHFVNLVGSACRPLKRQSPNPMDRICCGFERLHKDLVGTESAKLGEPDSGAFPKEEGKLELYDRTGERLVRIVEPASTRPRHIEATSVAEHPFQRPQPLSCCSSLHAPLAEKLRASA